MLRRPVRASLSLLAVAALAACGGGGGSSPKSPATEDALKTAVAAFSDAIFTGDTNDAYAYFTKECRDSVPKSDFTFMSKMAVSFIEGFADVKASDLRTGEVEVQNFTETSAEARAEIRDKNGDLFSAADTEGWTAWVYEDGGWHTSDCEEFSSEGIDLSGSDGGDPFSYPACSDLVDGQPVPEEFGTGFDIDISCDEGDESVFGFSTSCFTSDREYAESDLGYVFFDEGIFYAGEVRGCAPPCADLVDGQPVPTAFDDDSVSGFNLNCELPSGEESYSFEWDCFDSDRSYVQSDQGYAFVDDRIYIAGSFDYC